MGAGLLSSFISLIAGVVVATICGLMALAIKKKDWTEVVISVLFLAGVGIFLNYISSFWLELVRRFCGEGEISPTSLILVNTFFFLTVVIAFTIKVYREEGERPGAV
jgi:hypothetical protein